MPGWRSGFDSDADDVSDTDLPPAYYSREAEIARELDLSRVHETVKWTETPFTLAAQRKTGPSKTNSTSTSTANPNSTSKSGTQARSGPSVSSSTAVVRPLSPDDDRGKEKTLVGSQGEVKKRRGPVPADPGLFVRDAPNQPGRGGGRGRGANWTAAQRDGWKDAFGNPVNVGTSNTKARKPKPTPKPDLLDMLDNASSPPAEKGKRAVGKGGRGRGRGGKAGAVSGGRKKKVEIVESEEDDDAGAPTKGKGKAKAKEKEKGAVKAKVTSNTANKDGGVNGNKITFHAFPSGLPATSDHPILAGFERQRSIASQSQPRPTSPLFLSGNSASDHSEPEDLRSLLKAAKPRALPAMMGTDELFAVFDADAAASKAEKEAEAKAKRQARSMAAKARKGKGKAKGSKAANENEGDDEADEMIKERDRHEAREKRKEAAVEKLFPPGRYRVRDPNAPGSGSEDGEADEEGSGSGGEVADKQAVMSRYFAAQSSASEAQPSGPTTAQSTTQLLTPPPPHDGRNADLPTLTQITAGSGLPADSSSALPYSSPTEHRSRQTSDPVLHQPRPERHEAIKAKKMEQLAAVAAELNEKSRREEEARKKAGEFGNNVYTAKGHAVARPPGSATRKRGRSPQPQISTPFRSTFGASHRGAKIGSRQEESKDGFWQQAPHADRDQAQDPNDMARDEEWSTLPPTKKRPGVSSGLQRYTYNDSSATTTAGSWVTQDSDTPSFSSNDKLPPPPAPKPALTRPHMTAPTTLTALSANQPRKALFTPFKPPPAITIPKPAFRISTNRGTTQYGAPAASTREGLERFDPYKRDEGVLPLADGGGRGGVEGRRGAGTEVRDDWAEKEWTNDTSLEYFNAHPLPPRRSGAQSQQLNTQQHNQAHQVEYEYEYGPYQPQPYYQPYTETLDPAHTDFAQEAYDPVPVPATTTLYGTKGRYEVYSDGQSGSSNAGHGYGERPRYMTAQASFYAEPSSRSDDRPRYQEYHREDNGRAADAQLETWGTEWATNGQETADMQVDGAWGGEVY